MKKLKAGELIFDFSLYPRMDVDAQHVHYMKGSIDAGAVLPPPVVDEKSLRIIDGFHRVRAYLAVHGAAHEIDCVLKRYKNDGEMFRDAMRLNANHGRTLTTYDRVHSLLRGQELGLQPEEIAADLSMTVERLGELRAERVGKLKVAGKAGEVVPLKRTISHMSGKNLTQKQQEVNVKLSGMNQLFYVNQIIMLIEADLIETANNDLMERLKALRDLLNGGLLKSA